MAQNCITCGQPLDVVTIDDLKAITIEYTNIASLQKRVPTKCSRCDYPQDHVTYDKDLAPGQSV